MPLLRKQAFVKKKPPSDLRPEEDVFHCEMTNEIFRDYEEFFERVIVCNSLVWTCSITGRPGLTYQEALESEERARKHLESFPTYLRRVVLYLATRTKRSRLSDMNDDAFVFTKDRYFKGEIVDAFVKKQGKLLGVKIVKIIPPKTAEPETIVLDSDSEDEPLKKPTVPSHDIDAASFEYVVQIPDGKEFTVAAESISRKKGLFTRDKCKLFLKQNCEADDGLWKVKAKVAQRYKLDEILFMNYFPTLPPVFTASQIVKKKTNKMSTEAEALKKAKKLKSDEREQAKREKQEKKERERRMIEEAVAKKKMTAEEREALKEQLRQEREARKQALTEERMAKREELILKQREERERRRIEIQEERDKRREEKKLRDDYLREWNRQRDDMECDDLKPLPKPTPVSTTLPPELFGDAVMLLEFTSNFDAVLDMDDHFPDGFQFRTLEKALVDSDTAGPLTDLCEALLSTIISLQEEEEAEEGDLNQGDEDTSMTVDDGVSNKSITQLIQAATVASQWAQVNQGMPLKKLTFDAMTLSEIIRLHFLSAGARGSARSVKFRYQQRGGYTSLDDAGMEFKMQEPELFKELCTTSIFDLSPAKKLKILTALSNQILTYAASRDLIEDNWEKFKQAKSDLKHHQWAETKRERDEAVARYKKRMEERAKEKAKEEERRAQKKKEMEEKLKNGEGTEMNGDVEMKEEGNKKEQKKGVETTPEPTVRTRNKTAADDELRAAIEEASDDIDESKLTHEEQALLREKRSEKEAKIKAEYQEKENELTEELINCQNGYSIFPIGQDRAYRRFWAFNSIPGVFVESHDEHFDDSLLEHIEQSAQSTNPLMQENSEKLEDKSTASDKENESFDGTGVKVSNSTTKADNPLSSTNNINENSKQNTEGGMEVDEKPEESMKDVEKAEEMSFDQIVPDRSVTWAYYGNFEEVDLLIKRLNPRGFRESALKTALLEQKCWLEKSLEEGSPNFLQADEQSIEDNEKNVKVGKSAKSRSRPVQGKVKNASAQEFMELNLRETLLDMEERIYAGSLGALKVKSRDQWRDAIEKGSYSPQCDALTWSGQKEDVTDMQANDDDETESQEEEVSQLVKDLARALLQIEQGIEVKYMTPPLGDSEETKKSRQKAALEAAKKDDAKKSKKKDKSKDDAAEDVQDDAEKEKETKSKPQKTVLERWEESLMSSTSLSQVFLHLSTMETSIAWSKSALNARCRLCRRKGDAEQMLLCDGCDRGHHMYCLKPPVKKVPKGEWLCPDCRPKQVKKSPRKARRKSFADELEASSDEEEENEESSEEEEAEDEEEEADSSEEEEEAEDSDDEEEDSEDEDDKEESPKPTKISFKSMRKKPQPKSGRSTPSSVRSTSRAGKGSPADGRASRSGSRAGKRKSVEPNNSRPSSRAGKRAHSSEDESEVKQTTKSRGSDTSHSMKMMEKLVYEIVDHDDSWPFLKPVTRRDAPDYFDIVKKPMDLSTIRANINAYRYNGPADIAEDMRQMFKNCEIYNIPSAEEYKIGAKLLKLFEKRIKDLKIDLGNTPKEVPSKRPRRK